VSAAWTQDPDGKCHVCHRIKPLGYAMKDETGSWQAVCWDCVKPKKEEKNG